MYEQIIVFIVIGAILSLFISGRIRYEFVALLGLLVLTVLGIISPEEAFAGFAHPAVITVASVLVISSALIKLELIEEFVVFLNKKVKYLPIKIMSLMVITALLSAFMNNIGALALILPITLRVAKDSNHHPSQLLMPIAFSSLLGGMVTAIGTPPNLIISNYRTQGGSPPFAFFDFTPVGLTIVIIGILFTVSFGYRLIPKRKSRNEDNLFNIGDYLSEVIITQDSKMIGKRIRDFYEIYKLEVEVLSIIRNKEKIISPRANERLLAEDVLIIKTDSSELADLLKRTGLSLKGAKLDFLDSVPFLKSDDVALAEVVLRDDSFLIGRTAFEIRLRNRYNVNLVAVSRKSTSSVVRLKSFRFKSGDILLIQVPVSILKDTYLKLSCLPLAERIVNINANGKKDKEFLPLGVFIISIILTTIGVLPVQVAFSAAAVLLVIFKAITPREFYDAIEWSTIIMLGSLLPLGNALQSSGASDTIARILINLSEIFPPSFILVILMIMTMTLTNLISSTATAVLMGPIALSLASFMKVSPDAFLMGVCIAASSAFLTPIGHQSNMLVMGPGGYDFTDYWPLGLPLAILIIAIGTPLILFIWPL